MNTQQKMVSRWSGMLWIVGAFFVGSGLAWLSGIRLVSSPSVPVGLYRQVRIPIERGALVVACLPKDIALQGKARGYLKFGFCEGWVSPVIKRVGAVAGDLVLIKQEAVWVNGAAVMDTATLSKDSKGRKLEHVAWNEAQVIPRGKVFLLSNHVRNSLDSRYWGPISTEHIVTTAIPLWVKK